MKDRNDPAELRQYSGQHVMHEVTMLWQTAATLPRYDQDTVEYVALLESFATHLRNLIEFLFFPISRDYVRALHFFDDPKFWPYTTTPPYWEDLYKRACNEVNHLLTGRIDGVQVPREVTKIIQQIEPILREFETKASTAKIGIKFHELCQQPSDKFLEWMGVNVRHANIAFTFPMTLTQVRASTSSGNAPAVLVIDPKIKP